MAIRNQPKRLRKPRAGQHSDTRSAYSFPALVKVSDASTTPSIPFMTRRPSSSSAEHEVDVEVSERLLSPSQREERAETAHKAPIIIARTKKWKDRLQRTSLVLVIVSLTVYTFAMGVLVGIHWKNRVIDVVCLERISRPSPLLPEVQPVWSQIAFNGSLFKENIYRQSAGDEVDAAWESLGVNYRPIVVPEEAGISMGLADHVRVNDKYGGGFPANIEGLHHLHCLNLLRQALYFNADHYRSKGTGAWRNDEWVVGKHVTHCLDIIRQQLMCTVDMGAMSQIWVHTGNDTRPFVDFNTLHVCRDFESVRNWAEAHQVEANVPEDFLQPPDDKVRMYTEIP